MMKRFVKNNEFQRFEDCVSFVVNTVNSFYENKHAYEASKIGLMPLTNKVNHKIRQMMRKISEVCQYELNVLNGIDENKTLISDIALGGTDDVIKKISKVIDEAKDANDDEPLKEREFETLIACALLFSSVCNAHLNVSDVGNENEVDKEIQRLFDDFEASLIHLVNSITTLNIASFLEYADVDFNYLDQIAKIKIQMNESLVQND